MAKRMIVTDKEHGGKDTREDIDRLIHDMENDLQVISMEAPCGSLQSVNLDVPLMPPKTLRDYWNK